MVDKSCLRIHSKLFWGDINFFLWCIRYNIFFIYIYIVLIFLSERLEIKTSGLTIYLIIIFLSGSYEVLLTLDKEKHPVEGPIYYYVFNTLLYCLLVLHIYWWVLIYRMLVKQIQARGQLSDDVRSGEKNLVFYIV